MKSQTLNPQIYSLLVCLSPLVLLPCQSVGDDAEKAVRLPGVHMSSFSPSPRGPHRSEDAWDVLSNGPRFGPLCILGYQPALHIPVTVLGGI